MTHPGTRYGVLRYPGDLTGAEDAQPGGLLGVTAEGWPWEILDASYEEDEAMTYVHVQTASVEAVRKAMHRVHVHHPLPGGVLDQPSEPRHVRRQRLRAEGRLGKK